ncbi:hypothetical protein IIB79_10800 [candidate division KSB1 bacterium]|nr:hypothetical protein [candidate division KSB1 bacterium]
MGDKNKGFRRGVPEASGRMDFTPQLFIEGRVSNEVPLSVVNKEFGFYNLKDIKKYTIVKKYFLFSFNKSSFLNI